jgi:hypothetical protein
MQNNGERQPHASFQKNQKAVQKYADPEALYNHVTEHTKELAHAAPNITQGLATSVMNGQQFLLSKLPQQASKLPLSGEHKPPRTAMAKFNHYVDTINDPISVLGHVKKGTLRNEHLEVLTTVYPKLYEEMKHKVLEHMDPEKARNLPSSTRASIGKFLGQPLENSTLPQSIMANQAAIAAPRQGGQAQGGGKAPLGGLKQLNVANRLATETEQSDSADDVNLK